MKKLLSIISLLVSLMFVGLSPVLVHAQSSGVIDVEEEIPAAGAETKTPEAPDTGIAPTDNKVLQNAAVFIGGSLLGAGIGLSFLNIRKKRLN